MSEHARPAHVSGGENPHTVENTTDDERGDMLAQYLDRLTDEFDETPKLIPLDSEGKEPIITGRCRLDTNSGLSYLTDGDEAVRQIREDGARGFAIYAGKPEHNTGEIALVDVDDRETFPYEDFPATLMGVSGSARGEHLTYRNAGDVNNANGKDGVDGEVRAHNLYCITPGSIHPEGGIYHIHEDQEIATLHNEDIPTALQPTSDQQDTDDYEPDPSADVKAVLASNTWIGTYLAGLIDDPDRSVKDFAACRAFAAAGVSESDAYDVLANSSASKVDSADASSSYWSETWANAVAEEAKGSDDDGPSKPTAFGVKDGGYGYWKPTDDDPPEWVEWTNFEIEVNAFLSLNDGSEEIELTVHPRHGDAYAVVVDPTALNEKRSFKEEIACGRSTTFTGGEQALAKIKQFVGTRDAPELAGVRHIGRHGDELVLPDGSFTVDGWVGDPDRRYIEQSVGLERKVQITRSNDPSRDDRESVAYIAEHLPLTRDPERFIPALGWFCATPLRPFIAETVGEFPVLSITGGTGAGKTSTLELLWELLGVGGDPFSANDTTFTVMKTLSATDTLPVWFDEYKPSDMHPGRLDGFHDLVRKSTRGGVVLKGNADQTTTEYHLQAPVVVSGEQRFAGPAEQRRSILTTFREAVTDPDGEHAHEFTRLAGGSYRLESGEIEHYDGANLTAHAFAYHRWLLGFDQEEIADAWRSAEERVLSLLDEYGLGGIDSAGRTALQTIAFGLGLYRAFANEINAEAPIDQKDADRALVYVSKQQGNDGRRESHLDEFVRFLSLAAMDNEIEEDRHYTRMRNRSLEGWEIRVNMSRAYPKVAQYVRNHGLGGDTELLGESDYRERIKEQAEAGGDDSYITCYSRNSRPIGRAFGVSIPRAERTVEAFDDDHFYGRDEQGENGRYPSDTDPHEEHWRSEQ